MMLNSFDHFLLNFQGTIAFLICNFIFLILMISFYVSSSINNKGVIKPILFFLAICLLSLFSNLLFSNYLAPKICKIIGQENSNCTVVRVTNLDAFKVNRLAIKLSRTSVFLPVYSSSKNDFVSDSKEHKKDVEIMNIYLDRLEDNDLIHFLSFKRNEILERLEIKRDKIKEVADAFQNRDSNFEKSRLKPD